MKSPYMAEDVEPLATKLIRDAVARAGVELDRAALEGSATYLAAIVRDIDGLRELHIGPLTPPAHCHSDVP